MSGDGILIATTRDASLRALDTQGCLAVQSWRQITDYLRLHLGTAQAALLAQPIPDPTRGTTGWYAATRVPAPPIGSLPEPLREAARNRLACLLGDIQAAVAALRHSTDPDDRLMAELLCLTLVVPGPEHVRVSDGQPILVAWAHSLPDAAPEAELLMGLAKPQAAQSTSPTGSPPPVLSLRPHHPAASLLIPTLLLMLALLLLWFDAWRWVQAAPLGYLAQPDSISPAG